MSEVLQAEQPLAAGVENVTASPARPSTEVATVRNLAVDAYRGLVMLLMMGEVLSFSKVSAYFHDSVFWKVLAFNQSHTEWFGCSLHDLIQPSFSFLVGVALPYSVAGRLARGQSKTRITMHALWRSVLLVFLGVFLRSLNSSQT